jgi:hypothetical protein
MRILLATWLAALGPAVAGSPLEAQQHGRPYGGAAIIGTVRETVSLLPPARAQVCARLPDPGGTIINARCAPVDSTGSFRLENLPARSWAISVLCETTAVFGSKTLLTEHVTVSEAAPSRRDWVLDPTGCDPRPLRRVQGVYRGYFSFGDEVSSFAPCPADAWFLPSDSLESGSPGNAWVILTETVLSRWSLRWNRDGTPRNYYVHWRGTVVGPGKYGHFGMSEFEFHVDSILEVRPMGARRASDCPPVQAAHGNPFPIGPAVRPRGERLEILNDREGVWPHRLQLHRGGSREIRITRASGEVKKALLKSTRDIPIHQAHVSHG